jgi:hypothetical protein
MGKGLSGDFAAALAAKLDAAGEKDLSMTKADPNDIGPDGTVRLRCYLTMADSVWLSAGCEGLQGCQHAAPIGIRAAIRLMGPRRRCAS